VTAPWNPRDDMAQVLFDEEAIRRRIGELAAEITRDYLPRHQEDPRWNLMLVSVLRGSVFFLVDLVRAIGVPATVDFMDIASYGVSGRIKILKDLADDIRGRDVLVVDSVIDTGLTLGYLLNQLHARQPRSLHVATFINRSGLRLIHDLPLKYSGFDLEDLFVVGYGLDYRERYRNLPYMGILKDEIMNSEPERPRFAHPSEAEFARLLEFYRISWQYEPRTFVLREDENRKVEVGFSPDFYLPEFDLYIEVTTKKPHLMDRKLRQVESLRQQHPGIRVELIDRANFELLARKLKHHDSF